jgi:hypothetical protein
LELSVEVKDLKIDDGNVERELGGFVGEVKSHSVKGLAFVGDVTDATRADLGESGIVAFTERQLLAAVATWDWPKQNAAVEGMLHYLSHVEQNPEAVGRLLIFIKSNDEHHDSLVYFEE